MRQSRTTTAERTETVSTGTGTRQARGGFGKFNAAVNALNNTTFRVDESSEVIVFLEPENFTYALRHWIKYMDPENPKNQITRVEYCIEEDCPICDEGDRPKATAYFNVVNLAYPTKVLVWEATPDPTNVIHKEYGKLTQKGKALSDDGLYWVVSKEKGKNGFYSYSLDKLTEAELAEEWKDLAPLTGAQRDALRHRAYDQSYIEYKTREELQEFMDSLPTAKSSEED